MNTKNLSTLKINKLTQAQYERELAAGRIDEDALYLTPDEDYYTEAEVNMLLSDKSDTSHNHDSAYDTKGAADTALSSAQNYSDANLATAKSYSDTNLATAKTYADEAADAVKNDLLNGAGAAYDTLKELGDLIDDNTDAIEALETIASGKADATHTHTVSEINDITATVTELNYVDGVTGPIQTQLNKKADDYSIQIYNGAAGINPVKFMSVDYTSCNSENGVAIKLGMVSGHGNGSSYAFLQDAIIKVTYTGSTTVDNFKYYGAAVSYDGVERQYGDIFWVHNADTKVVDFYVLMGQYSRVNMTPWKRVTYSTGGSITQYSSATRYSEGTKEWGNNSEIATLADLTSKANEADLTSHISNKSNPHAVTATQVGALPLNGGTMPGNIIIQNSNPHLGLQDTTGNIAYFQTHDDGSGLKAGFGYSWVNSLKLDTSGNMSVVGNISENGTALSNKYASKSDVTALETRLSALENSVIAVHSGTEEPISELGEDGDVYHITD